MRRFTHLFVTALLVLFSANVLWAAPPTTQAKYLGFSNITSSGAKATWINGNGAGRVVVISTDNTFDTPVSTDNYSAADGSLSHAVTITGGSDKVIGFTTGTTRTITLSGLTPSTTYYIRIYEYNGSHGSYQFNTATGVNNPRSFTTLAGLSAPTGLAVTTDTPAQNTNTFPFSFTGVSGATGYEFTIDDNNDFLSPLNEYDQVDLGNLTSWEAYLPIASTYYIRVRVYNNSEYSPWASTNFSVSTSMPPKFLDGDTPSLTELGSPNYGNFDITINFDQPVYSANNGTGALTTSSFAAYAPSAGTDAHGKVDITAVSHTAGASTATITVRFNARVTTSEKFRIGPADATSIYSVNGLIPSANGVPMDVSLDATKGGQYSADISCPELSVLNTTDHIAFGTLQKAIDATTTGAADVIELKAGTTNTENVTVNKAVTITKESGINPYINGTLTLGGTSDVDLGGGTIEINGFYLNPQGTNPSIIVGNVYNGTVSIASNTLMPNDPDEVVISVQSNRGTSALTNLVIGGSNPNANLSYSGPGTIVYFNNDGNSNDFGITNVTISNNNLTNGTNITAIKFENVDLTGFLPPINLGAGNTNIDGMTITSKYVYSHATLDASTYLYPGIAVLATNQTALEGGSGVEYHTVDAAIAASADNGTQTVFLGSGTYSEAITLNEAVSLVGKGNTSSGTVLTNTVTASATAAAHTISSLYFDVQNTKGIDISSSANLTVSNNTFALGSSEIGVNVSAATLTNGLTLSTNTFNLNDATAKGINIPNSEIDNTTAITSNTFGGTAAGTGVYISTTNSTGASTGTLTITDNTFNNTVGDAIVFEDAVNSANSLSGATINIYNGNNFQQTGYGIKINDVATYNGFIGSTLPATIDLYGTSANTNFTFADIYGAAWYDLTAADATALLYPSIQNAENADLASTLNIGAGTYAEDVTFSGGTNLTTITGNGTTCELATGKTATLSEDLTISNFLAPTVVIGSTSAYLDDAILLVKSNGTIRVPNGISLAATNSAFTANKPITLTRGASDVGIGGTLAGTVTIANQNVTVSYLDFTGNPAINIAPTSGISSAISIQNNAFTLANGGDGILVETGNANAAGNDALNITGNSFAGGDATSKAINFRNQTTGFATFSGVNVYDGNTFNTPGYNFYKTQEGNICTYLPSVDVKNTTNNTYTTTNISGFYLNPAATTISTATETIVTDCTAPAAFTTGSVTTTTNAVAGWWNSDNSAINVQVPIANDASLAYGTVQIIASRDNWTTTLNLGSANQIAPGDLGTTKTYSFNAATFEGLTGFTENDVWRFNATITDFAGNQTTGTQSSTTITVDQTAPTVTFNSATADNIINIAEKTAGFNVNAQSNQNSTTLYVVNTTDNPAPTYLTIGTVGFASASAPNANTAVDIAVSAANANIIDAKTYKVFGMDQAGNLSSASTSSFTVDLTAPANFTVGTVDVPGEAKDGYYNKADHDANRLVTVVVPVANDATLTGGTIQVRAKIGVGGTYENVGTAHTILIGELGTNVTVTLTRTQFEGITGLAEGSVVYFTAVITDLAGNSTTGTESANTLIYDINPPAATTIASRTSVTAPVVANYFNASNTAVDVVVNIPNDATLVGGNVKLQARTNANSFVDVAVTTNAIANGDLNNTKTIQVAKTGTGNTDLDELTGWASGVTLDFLAVLTDAAGNSTDGTTFSPTMNVDMVAPAAPTFVLNGGNCINEISVTNVAFTVTGEANATVAWTLADGGNAHTLTGSVNLGTGGSATVTNQNLTSFNDGTITVSGTQTDLAGNVSASGNDTENKDTDDAGITTLTLTSNNFLPQYAKNGQTLTLAIDADEDVTVLAATIEGNNVLANLTNHGDADASTWDITWTVTGVTDGNTATFSITLQDVCGNNVTFNQANLTGTNVTYDNTAPTVSSIVRYNPSGQYTNADNPVFRVTFSEPVEITNTNVFTFSGTCTGTPTVQSATGATGQLGTTALYTTWDVTVGGIANENGTLTLNLNANLTNVRDKASNNPAAYSSGESYTIDNTPPAVAVTTPTYDGSRIQALAQLQGTYSDANGVTAGNVKVSVFRDDNNDGIFNGTDQYWNGSAFSSGTEQKFNANRTGTDLSGNWTYNINLTGYSAETAFKATVYATDVASNESTASRRFVVDPVPPQLSSITYVDNNTVLLTFNEGLDENWVNVPPGLEGNALATFYTLNGTINGTPFSGLNPTNATRGGSGHENEVTLDFSGTPFTGILQCDTIHILVTGVKDIAGNTIDANYDEATYTQPDVTAPYVVSITRQTPSGLPSPYLTNASQVVYRVTFSENVQNVDAADFTVTNVGNAAGTIASVSQVSPSVYDVTVNVGATSDGGTLTIGIAGGNNITDIQCAPSYSNNTFNQGTNPLTPETYTVDRTAPAITSGFLTHPLTNDYWNNGSHDITWDANNVSDGYSSDANTTLTFEYSILGDFTDAASVTPTATDNAAGSPLAWTVSLPSNTQVNTAKVRVKATDEAGNTSDWYAGTAFVLDNVAPTATITITPNNSPLNSYAINNATTSVTIDADFSENMDQGLAPTLALNTELDNILNDEAPTTAAWQSATKYRWVLAVNGSGLTKLDNTIDVTGAKDLAQNTMTPANLSNVKVDQVLPTVVSLTPGKSTYNKSDGGSSTTFQAVFSETMYTGNTPVLDFNGATLSGVFSYTSEVWSTTTNTNDTYTATDNVTDDNSTTDYAVKLRYASGATDLAGNAPAQTLDDQTFIVDMVAPVISWRNAYQSTSFNTNTSDKYAKIAETVYFEFTASEALPANYLNAPCGIATFSGEGGTNYSQQNVSGTQVYYIYKGGTELQTTPEGELTYQVRFVDAAGNCSNTLNGNSGVIFDKTAPVISNIQIDGHSDGNVWLKSTATGNITFNLTEQNPTNPTVSLYQSDGTTPLNVATATYSGVTGTAPNFTYTYTVTGLTGDFSNCQIKVEEQDLAGNFATPVSLSPAFNVDNTAPTLTNVAILSSNAVTPGNGTNAGFAKVGDNVTLNITANESLQSLTGTIAGTAGTPSGSGTSWSLVRVMTGSDADGLVAFTIDFTDLAGNAGTQVTAVAGTGSGSSITFDKTNPVVTITAPLSNSCTNGNQTLTFNVTETNASATTQAKIAGGTLTNFTSGSAISTLDGWGAASEGTQTITVQHTDKAGNIGSATVNVNKDTQAPTISSITLGTVTLGDNATKTTTDDAVTFTVTFSEPVYSFDAGDITLYKPGTGNTVNNPDIVITGGNTVYTVTLGGVTPITGDGSLGITVTTSDIVDCANNALSAPMTTGTFTIDNTPPTVYNVVNNCDNSPLNGYTYNQAAQITFSEGVYTNNNATGALVGGDLNVTASSGNATLQSWGVISGSHTAGGTTINITTNWNGTVLGSEKLRADAATAASIYDKAGNAMAVAGSDQGGPTAPKNWDYAKSQIVILTQPTNTSTCETGTAQFTTSAQGGLSVAYQWQYYNGSSWVDLTNTTINGATFSNVTTSQLTVSNPNSTNWNGKQFRCNVTNDCGSLATNAATLTVNPNTYISTQPSNTQACYAAVNNNITVTAGGQPPVGYQWQYSADGVNGWANVANGTPANASYSGATLATLNIQGNIAAGTYYYRVIVSSQCGPNVTSNVATLTVNPLPTASLTVGGAGTICQGSSTNITVALSENGVNYQLRNNVDNSNVSSVVAGNGGTINLPTGTLNSTTTFNVLATDSTSGCSVQLSTTATVTVEATPVNPTLATATPANGSTVCQGSTVSATFTAGSGGNGTDSYQYSLDNGGSWTAYTPGNNITVGTQTVIIQGKRNATVCGTSWTTLATWNVELTPVAASLTKQPNTAAVCAGTTVRATWADFGSGGNGSYAFDYRTSTDGGTSWTNWTTYSYTQDGNYYGTEISTTGLTNVEIRATRNATYCSSATNTVSWTVNPLPTATISGTTPACQSTLLTATTNASNPSYQWKLNGGNVGTNSSTYTATASGNYTVVVTDGVTGCSNESAQYAVTIDALPTAYNVTGGPFCGGANIFIGLSGSQNGYIYNLKFAGNTVSTQTGNGGALTFNVNPAQVGTYTIEAVNGTCTQAMSGSVTVNPAPTAYAGADAFTCGTTSYTVNDATATNYASVLWTHNGSGTLTNATTLTPTYTPAAGDIGNTVTLTLTVNALNGCVNTGDAMVLTVTPQATANAGSDAAICQGGTFTVSTASASNYTSLQWTSNGTGIITNSTTLTPTYNPGIGETGNVTLTLTANGANGCNATDNMVLTINALPTATITPSGATTFCQGGSVTLTASAGSSYLWSPGGATTQSINVTTSGNYTVTVTDANGCTNTSTATTVTVNPLPTPAISGNNTVGVNANLSLTSTNTYSSYSWSGTGSPTITNGTSQTATFNWSAAGNYVVTLSVTDANGCSNSTTHNVTVTATQAPVITGNPSNATKCSNETIATFSVTSVSGVPTPTLQWQVSTDNGLSWSDITGGDYTGVNSTTLNVSNLSGKNGYQYKLYATNGVNPDAYSTAATLTVTPAETPSVAIASSDNDNTFCSGTSVTFTATPSNLGGGTVAYQWKLNGGNVGSNQNTYTTTTLVNNDQVSCVITITGGCVTTTTATSNTITNTVNTVPAQPSAITGNTTVCAGTNGVAYSVTNVSGVTYTWSYSGSNVTVASGQGTNSITLNFASNATSGTLTVTPSNDCGDGTAQTLAITVPAAISYSGHPADANTTDGGNASFSATVSNATSYQWQVSTDGGTNWANATGGVYSNDQTTTLNITGATVSMNGYKYKLLSSNSCQTNVASNVATLNVLASEPTTQATNITWAGVGADWIKIQWTKGNGSNRVVLCKQSTYSGLTEILTDGTTYNADSYFTHGDAVGGAYVVYNGDADTITVTHLTHNLTYAFKVFEYNGSGTSANYKNNGFVNGSNPKSRKADGKTSTFDEISFMLGEHFLITAISPNPVTNEVNFNIVSKEELPFTIEVYALNGDLVYSMTKKLSAGDHPLNLKLNSEKGGVPAGAYFLKVTAGGETLQQKFIYQP